jgi:hypothetical protein
MSGNELVRLTEVVSAPARLARNPALSASLTVVAIACRKHRSASARSRSSPKRA